MPRYQVRGRVKRLKGGTFKVEWHTLGELDAKDGPEAGSKAARLWPHITEFTVEQVRQPAEAAS